MPRVTPMAILAVVERPPEEDLEVPVPVLDGVAGVAVGGGVSMVSNRSSRRLVSG